MILEPYIWLGLQNVLGDNPTNAILFAGALLLLASLATLLIKVAKSTEEIDVSMSRGGH